MIYVSDFYLQVHKHDEMKIFPICMSILFHTNTNGSENVVFPEQYYSQIGLMLIQSSTRQQEIRH